VYFLSEIVLAADNSVIADLYQNQQFATLKNYYEMNQIKEPGWREFIEAVFEPDAEKAMVLLAKSYKAANDKILKMSIKERVASFYYARGYYETSQKILKDDKYFRSIISMKEETEISAERFGIQVGAFSDYQNATKSQKKLMKDIKEVSILSKRMNGKNLYVVVVGKYTSRNEAEKKLKQLENQKGIKGYIIQF
jgi:hypothetical protein